MKQRPATPYELALHYRSMLYAIQQFERYLNENQDESRADIRRYLAEDQQEFKSLLANVLPQLTDQERAQVA